MNNDDTQNIIDIENDYMQHGEPMPVLDTHNHKEHKLAHIKLREELLEMKDIDAEHIINLLNMHIDLHDDYESSK